MHEMTLVGNLLETAAAALAGYPVARVTRLQVQAGVLANLLPDAFEFAFLTLSEGTVFQGAELEVEKAPLTAVCRQCGVAYESMDIPPVCPGCGSHRAQITGGNQVVLANVSFDQPEDAADEPADEC